MSAQQKLFSELTDSDKSGYRWICLESDVNGSIYIRGAEIVKPPKPPDGMEWVEITTIQDSEQKFILCEKVENGG